MSRLKLTSRQRQRLQRQLTEARDVRLYRRTLAVLEFDRGRSVADIALMLGVTRQSVYNWVEAYSYDHDPTALDDADRQGRPRVLDEQEDDWLQSLLDTSPQDLGLPNVGWTVPLVRAALEDNAGRRISCRTIRRALGRLGYVWKRPRYVLAPDPGREKKTADPTADHGPAAAERRAGAGRDRPAALPTAARGLVAARGTGRGSAEWPERPTGHLRGDEPADRDAVVPAAGEGAQR
jgi:putative transposase